MSEMSALSLRGKKIASVPMVRLLFGLCWLTYFTTYLGRLNYSACLYEMIQTKGFSKGTAGLIGTGFFVAYGAGQFINGFLGDKLSPKWMIFTGIMGSGLANLVMPLMPGAIAMTGVWFLNGFLQSLIWSPIIRIFSDWIPQEQQKRSCVHINSCVPAGTFMAYVFSAAIIKKGGWHPVFYAAGAALLIMGVVWILGMRLVEQHIQEHGIMEVPALHQSRTGNQANMPSLSSIIVSSGILFFCLALAMQGILKDGVTTWVPTYVAEQFHIGSAASVISTTVIPLFNLGGVYLAALLNKRLKNEIATSACFFMICSLAVVLLRIFPAVNVGLSLLLFASATTAMMAVNTMLVSVVPIYFADCGRSSSISGILNSSAYVGGALSTYAIGALSEVLGWNATISIWAFCAITGVIACLAGRQKWAAHHTIKDAG